MVIVSLAIVMGLTYYVTDYNQMAKKNAARSKRRSYVELERKRISTLLSYSENCGINFRTFSPGGATWATGQPYSRLKDTSNNIFATKIASDAASGKANEYYRSAGAGSSATGVLTLVDIRTTWDGTPGAGGKANGAVYITYREALGTNKDRAAFTGSRGSMIAIPIYFKVSAGAVSECYAITDNAKISEAVGFSCYAGAANSIQYSTSNGTTVDYCSNTVTFQNTNDTTCSTNNFLKGFTITAAVAPEAGSKLSVNNTNCAGLVSSTPSDTTCPVGPPVQYAYSLTSGVVSCAVGGESHDGTCAAGQMLLKTGATSSSCLTVDCSTVSAYHFVNSLSNGLTCAAAQPSACGANSFPTGFDASGNASCGALPAMSTATCAASYYGVSVSRNTGTYSGSLNCAYYNKAKSCPSPGYTTYVTSFSSGAANCTTY